MGPATLVTHDGAEIPVTATLRIVRPRIGLPSWEGRVSGIHDLWDAFQTQDAKLRIPNGREGDIILTQLGGTGNPTGAQIQGSGPPPF